MSVDIVLGVEVDTREEAIRTVGALLVDHGYVSVEYVAKMFEREDMSSTFIGNGVAIPHGTEDAKATVKKTGISLLQVPEGVDWDAGFRYILFLVLQRGKTCMQNF